MGIIQIRDLHKRFNGLKVLDGLNLDVEEGETLVILGRSGVGKSVLLKHIIGITKPDSGTIDVHGVRISDLSGPDLYKEISQMGMLFQGSAMFDSMNVEDNVSFYLKQHGDPSTGKRYTKAEIEDRDHLITHLEQYISGTGYGH